MKRFYLLTIIFALLGMNQVWAETVTFDGTADWGSKKEKYDPDSFLIEKSHVKFSLTKNMKQYNKYSWGSFKSHEYFYLEKGKSSILRWWVDEGYTINVSAIYTKAKNGKGYLYTTRMEQMERKSICQKESSWIEKTYAVNDATDNLFGEDPTPLTNNEYINIDCTDGELDLQKITLTYEIAVNSYTVNYDGNATANLSGSMPQQTLTYGETTALNNLAFTNGYSVTFDEAGGSAVEDKELNSEFLGWATASDGEVVYANQKDFAEELKTTTGVVLNLYAKWGAIPSITLPATEKENAHFAGWYNGEVLVGVAGTVITPTADMNLVAKWTTVKVPHFEGAGQSLKVVETYDGFVFTNTTTKTPSASTSAKFYYIISEMKVTTEHVEDCAEGTADKVIAVEYDGDKTIIKALNQGTAKITFYQQDDEDNNIEAGHSATYKFSVEKHTPKFTWPETGTYYFNDTIEHFFWSNQTETAITVDTDKPETATIVDSALVTFNGEGTARITMTQAENYFWAEHSEFRDITPVKKNVNHVPFTMDGDNQASIIDATRNEGTVVWDNNGYKMSDGTYTSSKTNIVVLKIEGIPDTLHFSINAEKNGIGAITAYPASGNYNFEVFESATGDNEDWSKIEWGFENNDWFNNKYLGDNDAKRHIKVALSATTRYIRLRYHGTCWGRFENISVGERKQFEAEDVDFGQVLVNSVAVEKELVFKHANAGYNVSVELNEEGETKHFAIDHLTVDNTGGDRWGEETFVITYNPSELGEHSATVTFTDLLGNEKVVTITGKTIKITPVIINAPQAADIKIGQKLSDSELYGGEASVPGTFAWADDTIKPDTVDVHTYKVIFTPTDTKNYNTVEIDVKVKVTGTETAVDNTASEVKATKILRNGQVLILRDGKVYNLNGQEVR